MAKEKVTLTLDADRLAELRAMLGRGSLSAAIDDALVAHLDRLRHFAAVDEWLAELQAADGPVPPDARAWAADQFDTWQRGRKRSGRRAV